MIKVKFILLSSLITIFLIFSYRVIDRSIFKIKHKFNESVNSELIGTPLPDFPVKAAVDDSLDLFPSRITKGRSVVILYFDPYCPHCKAQINEIVSNIKLLNNILFLFVTPYPHYQLMNTYKEFKLERFSNNIIVGRDNSNRYGNYFNVLSVPSLFIYKADLHLYKAFVGGVKYDQILFETSN